VDAADYLIWLDLLEEKSQDTRVCQTREMVRRPRHTIQAATITWKVAYTDSLKQTEKGWSKTTRGAVT
jgi:hypothetical protein